MLACRVCLAVGIDDPEAWLDEAHPRQLALWKAFYQLEPWGAEFHRSANTASLLSGLIAMQAAGHGQEVGVQPYGDFMPSDWADQPVKTKKKKRAAVAKTLGMLSKVAPTANKRRMS